MDYEKILGRARHYGPEMAGFLRELVAIPSESGREAAVVKRIEAEIEAKAQLELEQARSRLRERIIAGAIIITVALVFFTIAWCW